MSRCLTHGSCKTCPIWIFAPAATIVHLVGVRGPLGNRCLSFPARSIPCQRLPTSTWRPSRRWCSPTRRRAPPSTRAATTRRPTSTTTTSTPSQAPLSPPKTPTGSRRRCQRARGARAHARAHTRRTSSRPPRAALAATQPGRPLAQSFSQCLIYYLHTTTARAAADARACPSPPISRIRPRPTPACVAASDTLPFTIGKTKTSLRRGSTISPCISAALPAT